MRATTQGGRLQILYGERTVPGGRYRRRIDLSWASVMRRWSIDGEFEERIREVRRFEDLEGPVKHSARDMNIAFLVGRYARKFTSEEAVAVKKLTAVLVLVLALIPTPASASFIGPNYGKCIITDEGIVLRGYVESGALIGDERWLYQKRDLADADSGWTPVLYGWHERTDEVDRDLSFRFRSEPHRAEGMAYRLVFRVLARRYLLAYWNDEENVLCRDQRTGV